MKIMKTKNGLHCDVFNDNIDFKFNTNFKYENNICPSNDEINFSVKTYYTIDFDYPWYIFDSKSELYSEPYGNNRDSLLKYIQDYNYIYFNPYEVYQQTSNNSQLSQINVKPSQNNESHHYFNHILSLHERNVTDNKCINLNQKYLFNLKLPNEQFDPILIRLLGIMFKLKLVGIVNYI